MATLVKLTDQLKQTVKGDVKMKKQPIKTQPTVAKKEKGKTGPLLIGKSVGKIEKDKKDKGPSKMDSSRDVYNRMLDKPRKEVLLAFITECGLTKAGASTYYSIHKKASEEA